MHGVFGIGPARAAIPGVHGVFRNGFPVCVGRGPDAPRRTALRCRRRASDAHACERLRRVDMHVPGTATHPTSSHSPCPEYNPTDAGFPARNSRFYDTYCRAESVTRALHLSGPALRSRFGASSLRCRARPFGVALAAVLEASELHSRVTPSGRRVFAVKESLEIAAINCSTMGSTSASEGERAAKRSYRIALKEHWHVGPSCAIDIIRALTRREKKIISPQSELRPQYNDCARR